MCVFKLSASDRPPPSPTRAASAASGANSATLGAFSGVISSLSGAVESSQRLFGALSTAGGIEGQAAVLRTSATLVMDQASAASGEHFLSPPR